MSDTVVIRKTPPDFAYLILVTGHRSGRPFHLAKETTIGRAGENDVCVDDETVSASHAKIRKEETSYVLYDLASENGTRVGGQQVHRHELHSGDRITFGEEEFVFKHLATPGGKSHG